MKRLQHHIIAGILFVLAAGAPAHFLYGWTGGSFVAGLFAPVSESIWEHMKLLFFPMLLYAAFMRSRLKKEIPGISLALCAGILLGTSFIPLFFYAYVAVIGHDVFFLDIADLILSTLLAFATVRRLALSRRIRPYSPLLWSILCICILCFFSFTYDPPAHRLFAVPAIPSES